MFGRDRGLLDSRPDGIKGSLPVLELRRTGEQQERCESPLDKHERENDELELSDLHKERCGEVASGFEDLLHKHGRQTRAEDLDDSEGESQPARKSKKKSEDKKHDSRLRFFSRTFIHS